MSAYGPKRTLACALHMSAFGGKADISRRTCFVGFVAWLSLSRLLAELPPWLPTGDNAPVNATMADEDIRPFLCDVAACCLTSCPRSTCRLPLEQLGEGSFMQVPKTKSQQIKEALAAGDRARALRLAAHFHDRSRETQAYKRGFDAFNHRSFYRQIGKHPDQLVAAAINLLQRRFR
jgi:hypothetical protein